MDINIEMYKKNPCPFKIKVLLSLNIPGCGEKKMLLRLFLNSELKSV